MKRVYYCIFILMAVVAVSFFSLVRVSKGTSSITSAINRIEASLSDAGDIDKGRMSALVNEWERFYKSISFAENTGELNDISLLFTELENSSDRQEIIKNCELIKTSLMLLEENETPYIYSLL